MTPGPRLRPLAAALAFAAFFAACVATLSGDFSGLFSREAAGKMAEFAAGFFPPALDAGFLQKLAVASLETLAISWLGTLIACVLGLGLALPAAGRWGAISRGASRLLLNVLRAIPELVWAALVVIAAGLGPFSGTLALAAHTTGVLGRLFAEALENVPPEPYLGLRRIGAGPVAAFCYATLPQVLPQLASYSLYRWEINIRAAAILGVVGAGGLGQMLHFHLSLFQMPEAAGVLIAMLVLVVLVDGASNRVRVALAR
jgi:phosphonate transport system permease protein